MRQLLLSLLFVCAAASTTAAKDLAGVGARPLTSAVAATYFIESVSPPDTLELAAVIFFLGEPGWTQQKTEWTFGTKDPAYSNFEFSASSLSVELSVAAGIIKLLGQEIDTSVRNVVVVADASTSKPRITHTERLNLSLPFESEPLREVLIQSESLRKALGLE